VSGSELAWVEDQATSVALAPGDAQALARAAWRQSGGTLTGTELGRRFGRSDRWGRQQIAAARSEESSGTPAAGERHPAAAGGTGGDTGGIPAYSAPAAAGTANGTPADHPVASRVPRGAAIPSPADVRQAGAVPLPLLAMTVAAVAMVTVVCAVVSYSHIRHLALVAGMRGQAGWLPLGVDGLVVASSCALVVDHHLGRPGQPLAWCGVALGLAGSLAANVLAVDPELVSLRVVRWVLAGYTPAALAVSGHLLFRMLGPRQ
jgi:hypothetical protein